MKKKSFVCLIVLFSMLSVPLSVHAIDNSPVWLSTQFDFSPAGARARGFGGAFVGLADDATAALINPAGLAQLPKKQFALEFSFKNNSSDDFPWVIENYNIDEVATLDRENINSISFLSFSLPVSGNLYGAMFYNNLAQYESSTFIPETSTSPGFEGKNDLNLDELGISIALKLGNDKLKIGAGISVVHMDLDAQSQMFMENYSDAEKISSSSGDYGMAYRVGGLWQANECLRIGASANIYPTLDVPTQIRNRTSSAVDTKNRMDYFLSTFELIDFQDDVSLNEELGIPDVFSAGASYQLGDHLTFSFEARLTMYSQIEINGIPPSPYRTGEINNTELWNPDSIAPFGQLYVEFTPDQFKYEDAWSWHFGGEYLMLVKSTPVAFRLGGYYEQAHGLKYTGKESDYSNDSGNKDEPYAYAGYPTVFADMLDGGDDLWHFTPGIGAVFNNRYQIDLAVDLSKETDECLISFVYQF